MGTRTASPRGRYGERYTHAAMLRGVQANFAKKASTKPTLPGLPPGRLMAVSDIIPYGQKPELHTLKSLPAGCRNYRTQGRAQRSGIRTIPLREYGQAPSGNN